MFLKSFKDFFKNPIITLPNILISSIMAIFSSVFLSSSNLNNLALETKLTGYEDMPTEMAKFMSYVLLMIIFYFFINPFVVSLVNIMAKKITANSKPNFIESLKESPKYYWQLFGIMVLKILIFIGVCIVFMILAIPYITAIQSNPNNLPVGFSILLFLFITVSIILNIILLPIETILVYDNSTIGAAFSKGFKFGCKNFLKLTGVSLFIGLIALIINYLIQLLSPNLSIISTIIISYMSVLLTMYIMNLYANNMKISDFNMQQNILEEKKESETDDNENNENENKFII